MQEIINKNDQKERVYLCVFSYYLLRSAENCERERFVGRLIIKKMAVNDRVYYRF